MRNTSIISSRGENIIPPMHFPGVDTRDVNAIVAAAEAINLGFYVLDGDTLTLHAPPQDALDQFKHFFHAVTRIAPEPTALPVREVVGWEEIFMDLRPHYDALGQEIVEMNATAGLMAGPREVVHFSGVDANGPFDMRFRTYDEATDDPSNIFGPSTTHHLEFNYNEEGLLVVTSVRNAAGADGVDFAQ